MSDRECGSSPELLRETAGSLADALRRQRDELRMQGVPSASQRSSSAPVAQPSLPAASAFDAARANAAEESAARATVGSPANAAEESAANAAERSAANAAQGLSALRADLGDCRRCGLCEHRSNIVFGTGNPNARLLFIGEAPGAREDALGEPFVGRAGELLDRMIAAMSLRRSDVYIANVIKCRPPGNRDPLPDEVASCAPFLLRQVGLIQPEVIVTLGRFAAQSVLRTTEPISRLRGQWRQWENIPVMPTFHPAYLLRTPAAKREAWNDLQEVMRRLGLPRT